ncbi:hypothetical protein ACHAWF_008153 [Thalassiosira exigua]
MQRANILASSFSSISTRSLILLYNRRTSGPLLARRTQTNNMRYLSSSSTTAGNSDGTKPMAKAKTGFGSFATKAFVATATASTSYAAYYCVTALLFGSVAVVNGEGGESGGEGILFKEEKKKLEEYGIEYVGFDSYPGVHLDDGTGVATKEVKAASAVVVSQALDAAGLDETGIVKGAAAGTDDNTLDLKHAHRVGMGSCPPYGCPFLPLDVHYQEEVKALLEDMRKNSSSDEGSDKSDASKGMDHLLRSSGSEYAATLTLIGYKGGRLDSQINQDRALALAPYLYWNINSSNGNNDSNNSSTRPVARLIGAFDGHAKLGERVSEYVVKTLPALLGKKLVEFDATIAKMNGGLDQQQRDHRIARILRETFLELDATSPADPSGGCTASMVLQLGTKIYVANAGDSRSFVGVHVTPPSKQNSDVKALTSIIHSTREDKPHLSTERERVESMGGTVFLPNGFVEGGKGTTRVLYLDPTTGSKSATSLDFLCDCIFVLNNNSLVIPYLH